MNKAFLGMAFHHWQNNQAMLKSHLKSPLFMGTPVSAARRNMKLLHGEMVFKSPFWIQKLCKAKIRTEYSCDLVFSAVSFSLKWVNSLQS